MKWLWLAIEFQVGGACGFSYQLTVLVVDADGPATLFLTGSGDGFEANLIPVPIVPVIASIVPVILFFDANFVIASFGKFLR